MTSSRPWRTDSNGKYVAHLLGVDGQLLLADELGVVGDVGAVDVGGLGTVLAQPFEQHGLVALGARRRQLGDAVDELADGLAAADHLHLGVVVRPRLVAEQRGVLATDGEDLLEHAVVGRPGDGEELGDEVATCLRVPGEGAERHDVGVVGRHRDEPLVVDRVGVDPVLRQAGEPLGAEPDAPDVLADVLAELLAQQDGPLAQLRAAGHASPRRGRPPSGGSRAGCARARVPRRRRGRSRRGRRGRHTARCRGRGRCRASAPAGPRPPPARGRPRRGAPRRRANPPRRRWTGPSARRSRPAGPRAAPGAGRCAGPRRGTAPARAAARRGRRPSRASRSRGAGAGGWARSSQTALYADSRGSGPQAALRPRAPGEAASPRAATNGS